jgi:LacI family transcriptional regulator, gluconate utilization system Gnt-I transcriptional repressor
MTVSKVLRGTGRISAATRERVIQVADELGYVRNGLAGALSSQNSQIVGVLIPSIGDMVYSGVLAGINAVLVPRGLASFIGETFFDPQNEARLVRMMLSLKPAGLILTGGLNRTPGALHLLRQSGVRCVQLWDGDRPDLDTTVGLSHIAAGQAAADVFLAAGLRDACFIGAQLDRDLCAARRLQGFRQRMTEAGGICRVLSDDTLQRDVASGQGLTAALLNQGALPEAIHYLNDAMAIGGLRALLQAGVNVPGQTSVIGFNGTSLRHAIQTRLTTIEIPLNDVGTRAASALLDSGTDKTDLVPFRVVMGTTVREMRG